MGTDSGTIGKKKIQLIFLILNIGKAAI